MFLKLHPIKENGRNACLLKGKATVCKDVHSLFPKREMEMSRLSIVAVNRLFSEDMTQERSIVQRHP